MRRERARGADILKFFFFSVCTCKPASHFEALTVFSESESEKASNPEFGNQIRQDQDRYCSVTNLPIRFLLR